MALGITISFNTTPGHSLEGLISIRAEEPVVVPGNFWHVYFTIIAPDDSTIYEASDLGGTGDIVVPFGNTVVEGYAIPLDSNGEYMAGGYTIQVWTKLVSDIVPIPDAEMVVDAFYPYHPHNVPTTTANSNVITVETLSCITGLLKGRDATDYDTQEFTLVDRTLTIEPPAIDGRADVVDTDTDVQIVVAYANIAYPITYNVSYYYDIVTGSVSPSVVIRSFAGVLKTVNVNVDCGGNLCSVLNCFKTYMDGLRSKAVAAGGFHRLPGDTIANYELIIGYLTLAFGFKSCGNTAAQIAAIDEAEVLLGACGCNCAECSNTDPIPFVAAE